MPNLNADQPVLLFVLNAPERVATLEQQQWRALVCQARAAKLLPYLGFLLRRLALEETIPRKARDHIESAMIGASSIYHAIVWELECLTDELRATQWMVLKGGGYAAVGLPHARYRETGDVDLLLHREALPAAEIMLKMQGWQRKAMDAYDEHYYRVWSHEVPPLVHPSRGTVLDLHHDIYPVISKRVRCDIDKFWLGGGRTASGVLTASPEDLFLHSALHLFMQEEFARPLRDLVDLKEIVEYYRGQDPAYFANLEARSLQLNLGRPFWLAARYLRLVLGVEGVVTDTGRMSPLSQWLFDWCFLALVNELPMAKTPSRLKIAKLLLTVRGHWLKMPAGILAGHIAHKMGSWLRDKWAGEAKGYRV